MLPQGSWAHENCILLGLEVGLDIDFAHFVSASVELPLWEVLAKLNLGDLTVPGDFCVAVSAHAQSYCLLYKSHVPAQETFKRLANYLESLDYDPCHLPSETFHLLKQMVCYEETRNLYCPKTLVDLSSTWSLQRSIHLGFSIGQDLVFAPFVKASQEQILFETLAQLNAQQVKMSADLCVAFCFESQSFYLLFKPSISCETACLMLMEHMETNCLHLVLLPNETSTQLSKLQSMITQGRFKESMRMSNDRSSATGKHVDSGALDFRPTVAPQNVWRLEHVIHLGFTVGKDLHFAPFISATHEQTLHAALHQLNTGELKLHSDMCVAFCVESQSHYLLYKPAAAYDKTIKLLVQHLEVMNLSFDLLPLETVRALSKVYSRGANLGISEEPSMPLLADFRSQGSSLVVGPLCSRADTKAHWHLDNTIFLGTQAACDVTFAPFVGGLHNQCLKDVIGLLNTTLKVTGYFCVAFCTNSSSYYLLFKSSIPRCVAVHMLVDHFTTHGLNLSVLELEMALVEESWCTSSFPLLEPSEDCCNGFDGDTQWERDISSATTALPPIPEKLDAFLSDDED